MNCWFNEVNRGDLFSAGPITPTSCTIRQFRIEVPAYTYCANHPKRRPERDEIPIGPAFMGDDSGNRWEFSPSPDTEIVRQHLLDLLMAIPEEPESEYPMGHRVDETVVLQLALFKEVRARDGLKRIAAFNPDTRERGPFRRTRHRLVQLAKDALDMISEPTS
jgi:hypothetical protein